MSIFLAFSLQKRLEHILNSMPGYPPYPPPPPQPLKILWHAVISPCARRWEHGLSCLACPNRHACWGTLSSCEVDFGSPHLGGLGFGQGIQALPFFCVCLRSHLPFGAPRGFPAGGWRVCTLPTLPRVTCVRVSVLPPWGAAGGARLLQLEPRHSHPHSHNSPQYGHQ